MEGAHKPASFGQPSQQQGLFQLFLEDQKLFDAPAAAREQQGGNSLASGGSSCDAPAQALGWGGQPINDSSGYKVPWFGRRRGPQHRQRQARSAPSSSAAAQEAGRENEARAAAAAAGPSPAFKAGVSGVDVLSVEQIVQLLKRTPRSEPVPGAVLHSLHHLDSRTVALLLKDVSKAGMDSRSIEVFDWLRGLPERHPLRHLCDVYTYTAMISLCIYQQNVDRARELLEEMRQRGVERNVHTYTALMNVCIKCGKLAAAIDIFGAMKGEGCTPNVVTYNTLIDVYGKLGKWDRAVGVLSMMRSEGVAPALRTFNTLIIACNMCNQPREALAVYKELQDSGFEANSTTYNALISAYGKLGQLECVLEVYKDMVWRGLERSVITYSSLISACEKAGRWETALQLFEEMQREGCTPNTVTYNSLITACGQGAQWEKARQVFEQMQTVGCAPDVVTFTALISAYERGGQWLLALEAFEEMVARGCRPDAIVYNAIIDALWQTGVIWAQAKARELFAAAVKQGHFRNERVAPDGSRAEVSLHALTAGVAMLSLQSFLLDLQNKVNTTGDSSLPAVVAIVTDAGSASREQGNFIIKDAASTSLSFWGSPFRAVQDRTYLGLLEASGAELAAWLRSPSFAAMMTSLFPTQSDAASLQQQPRAVQQQELSAQQACQSAFEAVRRFEASHNLALQNMGISYLQLRSAMVGQVLQKGGDLRLPDEVVHDAVLLLDRAGSTGVQVAADSAAVVSAAVLLIAAQQTLGSASQQAQAGPIASAFNVQAQAVLDMSWQLRHVLQQDTVAISSMRCLKVYMERLGYGRMDKQRVYLVAGLPMMLAVEAHFDTSLLNCRPSVVAAALLYAERRQRGAVPFWPSMLAKITGYEDLTTPELACAVKSAQKMCRKAQYTQLYKTQSAQVAAQLLGLQPGLQQQQQVQQPLLSVPSGVQLMRAPSLGLQQQQQVQQPLLSVSSGVQLMRAPSLGLQLGEQQQQQRPQAVTAGQVMGMQADFVVPAPQQRLSQGALGLATSGLTLQPTLSGNLSAHALSTASSVSSSMGPVGSGSFNGNASVPAGLLVSRAGALVSLGSGTAMQAPSMQQGQMDLALLAQLQQQEQQLQQQQQEQQLQLQQQQQQPASLPVLGATGVVAATGARAPQLGSNGFLSELCTSLPQAMFAVAAAPSAPGVGFLPASTAAVTGSSMNGVGPAAAGAPAFTLGIQGPMLLTQQQQPQLSQVTQDDIGLDSLALTLTALGLHQPADGQLSMSSLEAALRQQC